MMKTSSSLILATLILPFSLAACSESFTATGGSGGGTTTTTSAGGNTSTGGNTSNGGASTGGSSTGGNTSTGGASTGGSTGGTGGAPQCTSMSDCGAHQDCVAGACVCTTGYDECNGACVDVQTDPMNCGMCGVTCGYSCHSGACNDPVDIAAGGGTTCAVLADGSVYCWGFDLSGQFGNGAAGASSGSPVKINNNLPAMKRVFVGKNGDNGHICASADNGNLYCWGVNQAGKLGIGLLDPGIQPVTKVTGSPFTTDVGLGSQFSVSISNGKLLGWGANDAGQLGYVGIGTNAPNSTSGLMGTAVAAGGGHTCVIGDNKLTCFGRNLEGQIGVGSTSIALSPTDIDLGEDIALKVAAGDNYTCVATDKNTARCWGQNGEGQLGLGSNNTQTSPGAAANTQGAAVSAVFAGGGHTGAIAGESLYLWGRNNMGQVTPNSGQSSFSTPQKVTNLHTVVKAALGTVHTCVLDSDGGAVSVLCWGGDNEGQLGNGATDGDHVAMTKVMFP